jgi:DNA-binding MarR family transcriptional regulator
MASVSEPVDLEQLASELNSVAIHLLRRIRTADASLGVTPARLSALSVIVFGGPLSMTDLASAEQVAPPTMSKLVAALEHDGFVRREPDPRDGRAVRLIATRSGQRLMQRGRRLRIGRLTAELGTLSPADQAVLQRAAHILRALESAPTPVDT